MPPLENSPAGALAHRLDVGGTFLLSGDQSAIPAIRGILDTLSPKARGRVFIEVQAAADISPLSAPGRVTICWLVRDQRPGLSVGEPLARAVRAWLSEMVVDPG